MDQAGPLLAPERPAVPHQPKEFTLSPPWHMGQPTLQNWQLLPAEMKDRIWDLAISLRNTRPRAAEDTSRLGIDLRTALNVALVSRDCYRKTIGRVYQRIRIERPSALQAPPATPATRPTLGLLVEALHAGPEAKLSDYLWPLRQFAKPDGSLRTLFATSLGSHPLRPDWCCPWHEFRLPPENSDKVSEAITAALGALDVDVFRRDYDQSGRKIGSDAWHVRLFEAQAAAELYLVEIGRREKENKGKAGERPSYPRLALVDMASLKAPNEDVLELSRSQLREHIVRPRAKTDHFEHPVLFARSGVGWSYRHHAENIYGDSRRWSVQHDGEDVANCFSGRPSAALAHSNGARRDVCDPLYFPIPATATIGGILGLVRAVLSLTPNLKSLSLNSYLDRVVCGARGPAQMPTLRCLTIGPQARNCEDWLKLDNSSISGLETLRVAGHLLAEDAVSCIVGDNGALPQLRSFQYSSSAQYPNDAASQSRNIVDIVQRLCGLDAPWVLGLLEDLTPPSRKRLRQSSGGEEEVQPSLPTRRSHPLYIELRLHPEDAKLVLDAAPTVKMREAWRTGAPMPGSAVGDRIQVFVSRGYDNSRFSEWAKIKSSWEMQGEAEEWWDEGLKPSSKASEGAEG